MISPHALDHPGMSTEDPQQLCKRQAHRIKIKILEDKGNTSRDARDKKIYSSNPYLNLVKTFLYKREKI